MKGLVGGGLACALLTLEYGLAQIKKKKEYRLAQFDGSSDFVLL